MNVLRTEDLKKYYGTGASQVRALDGIDLEVEQGEFLAVVGTSGSLTGYAGGLDKKIELLVHEGVDMKRFFLPKKKPQTV